MSRIIRNLIQQEILTLNAAISILYEMHNYQIICSLGEKDEKTILFQTSISQKLYFILLSDFLGKVSSEYRLDRKRISIFEGLEEVVQNPQLGHETSSSRLKTNLKKFRKWLEFRPSIKKLWFPDIGKEVNLKISRENMIFICANINKHSILKLTAVRTAIKNVFQESSISITDEQVLLCMENFHEWFHDDILIYHASVIAEMLVRIQWSIRDYLMPLFNISYIPYYVKEVELNMWKFEPPAMYCINDNKFIFSQYYALMNFVKSKPIIPEFNALKFLKGRY